MTKGAESSTGLSDLTRTEVLRLAYVDGLSVRAIARRLSLGRKAVRKVLGRGFASKRALAPVIRGFSMSSEPPRCLLLDSRPTRLRCLFPDGKPR